MLSLKHNDGYFINIFYLNAMDLDTIAALSR